MKKDIDKENEFNCMKSLLVLILLCSFLSLLTLPSVTAEFNKTMDLGGTDDVFADIATVGYDFWVTGYTNAGGNYRMVLYQYNRYGCLAQGTTYGLAGHTFRGYAIVKDVNGFIWVAGEKDGAGYVWKFNSAGAKLLEQAYASDPVFVAIDSKPSNADHISFGGGSTIIRIDTSLVTQWKLTDAEGSIRDIVEASSQIYTWNDGTENATMQSRDVNTGALIGTWHDYSFVDGLALFHGADKKADSGYLYWAGVNTTDLFFSEATADGYLPSCLLKNYGMPSSIQSGGLAVDSANAIHIASYSDQDNYTRYTKWDSPCTLDDGWTVDNVKSWAVDTDNDNSAIIVGESSVNADGGVNAGIWQTGAWGYCGEANQTSAMITRVQTEIYPYVDATYTVKIWVKNVGAVASDFVVGLTIGDGLDIYTHTFANSSCNRDCYQDGKGDYVHTGVIAPNDEVMVTREYKYRHEYFTDVGHYYDISTAVYTAEYQSPDLALDWMGYNDLVYMTPPFAYPISVKMDESSVSTGDVLTVTSWIYNNATYGYNFTLGMSLGIWNVADGQIYTTQQAPTLPPCNTECYQDGKGSWQYLYIPSGYTSYFSRSFKIPDYFLKGQPFDVAVGVYTQEKVLIDVVYFKNITMVTDTSSASQTAGSSMKDAMDETLMAFGMALGTDLIGAKMLIWSILTVTVSGLIAYFTSRGGQPSWQFSIITALLMIIVGTVIGFVPAWIGIVFVIIAGFIIAQWFRGAITS